MGWDQRFADEIPIAGRGPLRTLRDAGAYIAELPEGEQRKAHWRDATEALLLVVECDGDPMLARIGMMRALRHGQVAAANSPRGKRARVYKLL